MWTLGRLIFERWFVNTNTTDQTRKSYGNQIEDMLNSCFFNYQRCDSTWFTYFYHIIYGNCYTFNGGVNPDGSPNQVNYQGSSYGLTLELYLGDPYHTPYYHPNDGIYLSIQKQSDLPL